MNNTLHIKLLLSSATALLMTVSQGVSAQELELKPVADLSQSFQTARVCFITDTECGDIPLPTVLGENICSDGYTYSDSGICPQYYFQETCIDDPHYIRCDAEKWCRMNGYEKTSCTAPQTLNQRCPNGLELYKQCILDIPTLCKNENPAYVNACQNGWKLDDARLCTYSPTYGICCNKCEGFDYTAANIPQGYIAGERCDSCSGAKYKKVINPCSGYSDCSGYGPAVGANICWSGETKKYSKCETCSFTKTQAICAQTCQSVSGSSCSKNGTTYYASCGNSTCNSSQTCNNGTCICGYSITASYCTNDCYTVSSNSCVINGTTYYSGCGSYKCNWNTQSCNNGTCACDAKYKYACASIEHAAYGYENASQGVYSCEGKYTQCTCDSGYSWNYKTGTCDKIRYSGGYCCDDRGLCNKEYSECKRTLGYIDCTQVISLCYEDGGVYEYYTCLYQEISAYLTCKH